jgi:hypothetical protein
MTFAILTPVVVFRLAVAASGLAMWAFRVTVLAWLRQRGA